MKCARGRYAALLPILLAACGGAKASDLVRAAIDTLPGNILRITSSGPTAWTDSAGARLVEEARFSGEDGAASEISEARSIGVDDLGRAYVVDTKPALIKVYSPDGRLVRTIGREGDGPGEFRAGFIAVRGGFVVLHDPQVARTSVWDTAGTYVRSWHDSCCFYADIQIDKQNRIYVPSMVAPKPDEKPRGWPYVRWTLDGTAVDTLFVPQRNSDKFWTISAKRGAQLVSQMSTSIPFMPSVASALHPMEVSYTAGMAPTRLSAAPTAPTRSGCSGKAGRRIRFPMSSAVPRWNRRSIRSRSSTARRPLGQHSRPATFPRPCPPSKISE